MSEDPDLRDALSAAFDATEAPAADAPSAAPEAPAEAASAEGRARDEHGRFAPKEAAPSAEPTTDQPAAAAPEAQAKPEPIRVPASWSPEAKAAFPTLPPAIQAEIAKRERDVEKGLGERASQLKRYEPLEAAIAPHRDRLAIAGVDEGTYVRSLIAADEALRGPNRLQAFAQIAQGYGIDLRQFSQPSGQQPQAQLPPQLQGLFQEVSTLKTTLAQQLGAQEQARRTENLTAVQSFAADPKHVYFENVREDMAALIEAGRAKDLADAYDKAIWARPDIRPLLLKDQDAARTAQAQEQARAKAEEARRASGSITGSPSPGASALNGRAQPASVRDSILEAWPG